MISVSAKRGAQCDLEVSGVTELQPGWLGSIYTLQAAILLAHDGASILNGYIIPFFVDSYVLFGGQKSAETILAAYNKSFLGYHF